MRALIVVASLAASLITAATAAAQGGDPIMPLNEVRQGMKCTGYTVFRGTEVDTFDVEVLDIVGGGEGARILVRVSGETIESTGIGAGFSGSPVYCRGSDNKLRNAGAISETIGDYGGRTVLATPIEQVLAVDPDNPPPTGAQSGAEGSRSGANAPPPGTRGLAGPLTVRGLSRPVFRALAEAAKRNGRTILQAPPALQQAPPQQPFRPGSAVAIGVSTGDLSIGAVGTVAYTDGPKVYTLGHQFDGVGARSLLLQDAYVVGVINNPIQLADVGGTYKLAGSMNDVGTVTNDGFAAVSGRIGGLPTTIPVRIYAHDEDRNIDTMTEVRIADEIDIGSPTGASALSFVAPLAVSQAAAGVAGSAPTRLSGQMCLRITLRERPKPIRICNRYVSDGTGTSTSSLGNIVALRAAADVTEVLSLFDVYKAAGLHITEVAARITLRRGQRQAFMRKVKVPTVVRPGQRIPVTLTVQRVRGAKETLKFQVKLPESLPSGPRELVFRGADADTGDDDLFGALTITLGEPDEEEDTEGPTSLKELVQAIRKIERYDGIRIPGRKRAYKHPSLRVGGSASATVFVRR